MKRLKYIVVKRHEDKDGHDEEYQHQHWDADKPHAEHHEEHKPGGWEKAKHDVIGAALTAMNGYNDYVTKHGSHFTDDLAKWASEQMTNAHGDPAHHWGVEDVKSAFERLGFKKPEENTWGDVAYSANMHYADYYGTTLKTEAECVKQAYADIADPDGYPGKIFNRWCADVIGKKVNVPWENFI